MKIARKSDAGKGNSFTADSLVHMAGKMGQWICTAAAEGRTFHEFESEWHEMIHRMANLGTGLFISQQGDGDLWETVTTDEGVTLQRSAEPVNRPFQTVFELFQIRAYVYARGPQRKCLPSSGERPHGTKRDAVVRRRRTTHATYPSDPPVS